MNPGNGHWRPIVTALVQAAKDNFVELGIGSACEEPVELYEQGQVRVFAFGGLPVALSDVMTGYVDSLEEISTSVMAQVVLVQ